MTYELLAAAAARADDLGPVVQLTITVELRREKPTVTAPAAAEPAVASWVAHPAPWLVPLPHQPIQLRAS